MVPRFSNLRQEFKPMATLALPVVMAELGWMTMGLVDTLMVGPLGAEAIGAVGVGSSVFMGVVIFAFGLFFGLDTLVPGGSRSVIGGWFTERSWQCSCRSHSAAPCGGSPAGSTAGGFIPMCSC
jgi:MatE